MGSSNSGNGEKKVEKTFEELMQEYGRSYIVTNALKDPLGHECFRLSPYGKILSICLPYVILAIFILLFYFGHISFNPLAIIFCAFVWICTFFVFGTVPAGRMAFLKPGRKNTWHINMGFMAWIIYNRQFSRRDFIIRDLARILRTAYLDRRIEKVYVTTWLFEPDNIPHNLPPIRGWTELKGTDKLFNVFPVFIMFLLAGIFHPDTRFQRQSPLNARWYRYVWHFGNLNQ